MIANSLSIFVFNRKFFIPTPAEHEIGSWETEPVAVVDFSDTLGFAEAIIQRLFQPQTIIYRETMPEGFISRKYTNHKSDTAFVKDVDCWNFGIMEYGSDDVYLWLSGKRGKGYYNTVFSNFRFNMDELNSKELELLGNVAKEISKHYDGSGI